MSSIKKQQHHVFEYYLKAWAESGSFSCYSKDNNKRFSTNPENVGKKRFFYQLKRLTTEDLQFIDLMIGPMDDRLRRIYADFVRQTQLPFKLEDSLDNPTLSPEHKQELELEIEKMKANLIEEIHARIESHAPPLLSALRKYDNSFYADLDQCIKFVTFLLHQYFRTDNLRKKISALPDMMRGHSFERTALLFNHIYAISAGASVYRDREAYKIIFLKNTTGIPLITGDQPVLNLLDPTDTEDIELYYPVSPETAILLTCDKNKTVSKISKITDVEVTSYNFMIFNSAADQVYSSDADYLDSLVQASKLQMMEP